MKKIALIMALVLLVVSFMGCTSTPAATATPSAAAAPATTSGGAAAPAPTAAAAASAPVVNTAPPQMHEVYSLVSQTIAFDGLRPSYYESRADIPKGVPKQKDAEVYIGFPISRMSSQTFVDLTDGARKRCEQYGYKFEFTDAGGSLEKQRADFEAFITKGVDAIIINPIEPAANELDVAKAVEQGVIVVGCGISFFPTAGVLTCVWNDNYGNGFALGETAAQKMADKEILNVGMILGRFGQSMNESKANGFVAGLMFERAKQKGKPFTVKEDCMLEAYNLYTKFRDSGTNNLADYGINLMGAGEGQLTANVAMKVADDLLTANPTMNLLYCDTDEMGEGVVQTLIARNVNYGNTGDQLRMVFGGQSDKTSMDLIREDKLLATCHGNAFQNSYVMVDLIHAVLEKNFDANNLTISTYAPPTIITKDNVDQWQVGDEWYPKPIEFLPISIEEWNAKSGH